MKFYIVDDTAAVRAMLIDIIESEDLGEIAGEASDGFDLSADLLNNKHVDILLIDLLMPKRDGIETIRAINVDFRGKIIMISQVETKEMIGEAYSLGIEHYITKPINRLEVINIIKKVSEYSILEKSISDIHHSINQLGNLTHFKQSTSRAKEETIQTVTKHILSELGIVGESGYKDLIQLVECLYQLDKKDGINLTSIPSLKILFEKMTNDNCPLESKNHHREIKAAEQRIRRAIHQSMVHIATLGLMDYTDPKFEHYASRYFDYSQIRIKMLEIEQKSSPASNHARINIKMFILMLYTDALALLENPN